MQSASIRTMLIFPLFLNFGSLRFSAHSFPFETCQCNWLTQRGIGSLNMASPSVSLDLGKDAAVVPKEVAEDSSGNFVGLSLLWDNTPEIRQRLRDGKNLLVHYDTKLKKETNFAVEKTTPNVKANCAVLRPVCNLINMNGRVPDIEVLEHQVQKVFSLYNLNIDYKTIQDQAWAIRHLISTLKGNVRPPKPNVPPRFPKEHSAKTHDWFIIFYSWGIVLLYGCSMVKHSLDGMLWINPALNHRTQRLRTKICKCFCPSLVS